MAATLRTALLCQDGNFVGREYHARLVEAGLAPDLVVLAGRMAPESVARERERTGGLWSPPPIPDWPTVLRFEKLAEPALWRAVAAAGIDVAIQGGVGILKPEMIAVPRLGILNVHPGRLPQYRGNACPEWAIHDGDEIWATAHMIDAGIDTGPVVCARRYAIAPGWGYAEMRANLYAHCAGVLVEALRRIEGAGGEGLAALLQPQDERLARYRPPMDAAALDRVKALMAARTAA